MNWIKCRVMVPATTGGECFAPGGECDLPAAIGIITETEDPYGGEQRYGGQILQLTPICADHAPEQIHEVSASMNQDEWAVVSLAYGVTAGSLT